MKDVIATQFEQLKLEVWPHYEWYDDYVDGQPLFKEPPSRFETPETVERACLLNEQKRRQTNPKLVAEYKVGGPLPKKTKTIEPLSQDRAALFLTFAEIDYADRDEIVGFALKYGLLGLEWESHINWAHEICQMKEAITLKEKKRRSKRDDERLLWLLNSHLREVTARVEVSPKMRLTHSPRTLLGAMWMQLSQGFVGGYKYRQCTECSRMFELSVDPKTGHQAHKKHCSDKCRMKNARKRKKRAEELWRKKTPLAEIIADKEVGARAATVRGWVKDWRSAK